MPRWPLAPPGSHGRQALQDVLLRRIERADDVREHGGHDQEHSRAEDEGCKHGTSDLRALTMRAFSASIAVSRGV